MAQPGELADLTAELSELDPRNVFKFEWSSPAQGQHLLLCGDWNRRGLRSSRTLNDANGAPIRKPKRGLTTAQRQIALQGALSLAKRWEEGTDTRKRLKRCHEPASGLLARQRRALMDYIRERAGRFGVKQKHNRHAMSLFSWLDEKNLRLDSVNAIEWASDGIEKNTDNYADRLRVAEWACEKNAIAWVLPESKKPKKPNVRRPFVDHMVVCDLSELFALIRDPEAEAFFRVVAATGCRPSEVTLFNWDNWDKEGRPNTIDGFSPKAAVEFTALCHPVEWIKDLDINLLKLDWIKRDGLSISEETSERITRHYSRLLKMVKKDLKGAGFDVLPTWTDLRHLWTIRADLDGVNRRIGAFAQAHSEKMATLVYLRHGGKAQVLAEAKRFASVIQVAC